MFLILSKIFYFFLSPFLWILLFFLIAFKTKIPKRRKLFLWGGIVGILFFSNSFIISEFQRLWSYELKDIGEINTYDVGIVLGGMATFDKDTKTIHVNKSVDRIWQALNLYHAKKIKKILISGDEGNITNTGLDEANQFKNVLLNWGIPSSDIITETYSRNTAENAIETKKKLIQLKLHPTSQQKALLITSGIHMRRAKAVFDRQKIPVDCYAVENANTKNRDYYFYQLIVPDFENYNKWTSLTKEIIGYVVYYFKGFI